MIDPDTLKSAFKKDPLLFPKEVLGVYLWEKQIEILRAIHEHERVAVRACNSASKTHTSAVLCLSFLFTHYPAKVITTSSQKDQVRFGLWKEIERVWKQSKVPLADAECFRLMRIDLGPDWFAIGIRPQEYSPEAMQGFHGENILIVFDEASGIPRSFFEAAESLMTAHYARFLVVGNPFDKLTPFGECFESNAWYPIRISAYDTPNVKAGKNVYPYFMSYDWPERMKQLWGEDSPAFQSRVLGEFPDTNSEFLVPVQLAKACFLRKSAPVSGTVFIGVDLSGTGDDMNVWVVRHGLVIKEVKYSRVLRDAEIADQTLRLIQKYSNYKVVVNIDGNYGKGIIESLKERAKGCTINAVYLASQANDPEQYFNLRTEAAFKLKFAIEQGLMFAPQAKHVSQRWISDVTAPKVYVTETGKRKLEPKKALTERLGRSTDFLDATLFTFATDDIFQFETKKTQQYLDIGLQHPYNEIRLAKQRALRRLYSNKRTLLGVPIGGYRDEESIY